MNLNASVNQATALMLLLRYLLGVCRTKDCLNFV